MAKMYADINYYLNDYLCERKEAISTASFNFYSKKASARIRAVINQEPETIPEELKMCCCEVAELIYKSEQQTTGVSSESVGGWSKSFESSEATIKNTDKLITQSIKEWLCDTGLLFAGVR